VMLSAACADWRAGNFPNAEFREALEMAVPLLR